MEIMPNDIVKHLPSGETWVVCGVDYSTDRLIPCGYPFPSIAKISDCELIESRYIVECQSIEHIEALKKYDLTAFIDVKSAMWHGII